MASSAVSPNNVNVTFKGRREMQPKAEHGGIAEPEAVKPARKPKRMSKHIRKARARGMISDKQMRKIGGDV